MLIYSVTFCPIISTALLYRQTFPSVLSLQTLYLSIKRENTLKENYRPVSILPSLSKIYGKITFTQMTKFFETFFYRYRCCFRRCFNSQQSLLRMLEKWKRSVDKGKFLGALLTDLGKAAKTFDYLDHELLIAKLNAYRFTVPALRKKRTKIHHHIVDGWKLFSKFHKAQFLDPYYLRYF